MSAAVALHAIFEAHRRRGGCAFRLSRAELKHARALYDALDADARRPAYWGFSRHGVRLATKAPCAARARFRCGDGDDALVVEGYDDGETWNGWRCPLIPVEEVERFIAWWPTDPDASGGVTYRWDADNEVIVQTDEDGVAAIGPTWVEHEEDAEGCDGGNYYNVGLGLCWDLVDEEVTT